MPVFYDIQKDRSFLGIKRNEDIYIVSAYPALTSLISQGSRDERTSLLKVEDKPEFAERQAEILMDRSLVKEYINEYIQVCPQNRFKNDAFKRVAAVSDRCKTGGRCTKKEIAEYLHVHPSTITREIQRNGYSRIDVTGRGRGTDSSHPIRCSANRLGWMQECLCKPQLMLFTSVNELSFASSVCTDDFRTNANHSRLYQFICMSE